MHLGLIIKQKVFPIKKPSRPFAQPGDGSHGTKLHILVSKLHSGTVKTMHLPLIWKFHCATCSPVYVILYHVTMSCKGPVKRFWSPVKLSCLPIENVNELPGPCSVRKDGYPMMEYCTSINAFSCHVFLSSKKKKITSRL